MRALIVCRYKKNFASHIMPFITEQAEAIRAQGVEIDYFTINGDGFLSYFKNRKPLLQKISEFKPDIIHAHYGLSGMTAVLQNKVPVVTTFHNGETLDFKQNILSSLASLKAKHVIYVAQHIRDLSYFKPKNNYSIIPCGVSLELLPVLDRTEMRKKWKFEDRKKYILFGGAFANLRKNYPLLKEGLELLNDDSISVLEMKGLSRQETTELMWACDVFALPTKSEGSPQALKEAMACGCPIVATDVADIKYLLGDIPGHYICTFDPSDVAKKIRNALNFNARTEGRKQIVELGLTNEVVATKIINIYNRIAQSFYA